MLMQSGSMTSRDRNAGRLSRRQFLGGLAFALTVVAWPLSGHAASHKVKKETIPMRELTIHPSVVEMATFGFLEVAVDLAKDYSNPFDPDEIQVWAEFATPSGRKLTIPGFYGQEHRLVSSEPGNPDRLEEQRQPGWRVRFTPREEGTYSYRVFVRDRDGRRASEQASLQVAGTAGRGFVRRDPENSAYFRFDDGSRYLPVGYNYSFWRSPRLGDYEDRFRTMASCGANWVYVIMDPFDVGVEWGKHPPGRYDLQKCSRLDYILEKAKQYGIMVLLSFNVHADTMPRNDQGWGWWEDNPYNVANGGPCPTGDDFFRMEEAKALYKQRIRYIVARWAHHPNVMGWMPITEIEGSALWYRESVDKDLQLRISWYKEMARYLKEQDPYHHLVSVSLAGASLGQRNDEALFGDPSTDFVQPHLYLLNHCADGLEYWNQRHRESFDKPVLTSEYGPSHVHGFDNLYDYLKQDQAMLHHHDGLWASFFTGGAGTAMHWFWRSVEQGAGLNHLRAIHRLLNAIQWPKAGYRPEGPLAVYWMKKPADTYKDIVVTPSKDASFMWMYADATDPVRIHPDGRIDRFSGLRIDLYSQGRRKANAMAPLPMGMTPPRFAITFPIEARLEITIEKVVGETARLRIADGERTAYEEALGNQSFPYHVKVPFTAGAHVISVENSDAGNSIISATSYRFQNCKETRYAPLVARLLRGEGESLLWITRIDLEDLPIGSFPSAPIQDTTLTIPEMPSAQYEIEWWDTYSGEVTSRQTLTSRGESLTLALPPILRDIACRIIRVSNSKGGS